MPGLLNTAALFVALVGGCVRSTGASAGLQGLTYPLISRDSGSTFNWYDIQPSENITWTDCDSGFKCARLLLPLDYSREADSPKAIIALQMLPANDTTNYKGAVLINPGGPGGAGTQTVAAYGSEFAQYVGPEYDIIGFDPRGTGATIPLAQCFDTESQAQTFAATTPLALNISDNTIPYSRAQGKALAALCQRKLGGNGKEDVNGTVDEWGGGRFMDSASVATDMLRIIDKLGQDKLNYIGLSYGTVLGQYFATMYPDKVGRFLIAGVCDAESYLWNSNLVETEGVIEGFFSYCQQGGPSKCPIYESSILKIKARVQKILDLLPLAVPFATQGPAVITNALIEKTLFSATYTPIASWPFFADLLHTIEVNNQTAMAASEFVADAFPACNSTNEPAPWLRTNQAEHAISCSDDPVSNSTADFDAYFAEALKESPHAAGVFAQDRLVCSDWTVKAKHRFAGPFTANTSSPIFVVTNILDPSCPSVTARRVHARFPGSGLLVQNSTGHVAFGTPSACTAAAVQGYFANGTLPANGTVCQPDELPFIGEVGGSSAT
ncbi:hypothetical protein PLICRDRAFT_517007 [Plicaturopsis crispa FD-325 SS-3]|nr:hypothetical protein PLICRDRAFT_517007 [Plicaturopsis crispa FD-325 SS-3]